jgi:hypothetical protein
VRERESGILMREKVLTEATEQKVKFFNFYLHSDSATIQI